MYHNSGKLHIDLRTEIKNKLKKERRTYAWLAHETGFDLFHLNKVLNLKRKLSDQLRIKINEVLETDF